MIKVLLVDDHELVRMGMSRMLSDVGDITVVGEACNGEEALTQAKKLKPNVVLMDVQMPGIGGIEATRKLAHLFPQLAILVVTICEEEPFPSRILKAGAMGYITKGTGLGGEITMSFSAIPDLSAIISKLGLFVSCAQPIALRRHQNPKNNQPESALQSRRLYLVPELNGLAGRYRSGESLINKSGA